MIDDTKEVAVLMVAGFFGSLARLVLSPEQCWKRWAIRFVVGISCAVCLGGFMGQLLAKWFSVPASETAAASGFVVGVTAEQLIQLFQARIEASKEPK